MRERKCDATALILLQPSLLAAVVDVHGPAVVLADLLRRTWAQLAGGLPLTRAALERAGADLDLPVCVVAAAIVARLAVRIAFIPVSVSPVLQTMVHRIGLSFIVEQ